MTHSPSVPSGSGQDLAGRVAVVTGGSSGIGLAAVRLLLARGAAVALNGRDPQRLSEAEAALRSEYPEAPLHVQRADVLDENSMQGFAQTVRERLGPASMLINNAGQGRVSTFANTDDAAWTEELHLKFFSIIRPTRAFLPQLVQQREALGDAAVVCVNSLLARQPEPHMVATSAARAGVVNLVRSLATEFAPQGVRVNGILVGLIESGQWRRRFEQRSDRSLDWPAWSRKVAAEKPIPLGRLGRPEEAAQALVFLASPAASYTTGAHLDVSGGVSRHA